MEVPNQIRRTAMGDIATFAARRTPDKIAFVLSETGREVTFQEFDALANRTANALLDVGFEKGQRIGIVAKNSIDQYALHFGALKIGAVCVFNNVDLLPEDHAYQFDLAEVDGVFFDDELSASIEEYIGENDLMKVVQFDRSDRESLGESFASFIEGASTESPDVEVSGNDPALIMYTSGTTSKPKGVIHTHDSYIGTVTNLSIKTNIRHDDVQVGVLPLFHIHQDVFAKAGLGVSATKILYREFDPERLMSDVEQYDITFMNLMSSMYRTLFNEVDIEAYEGSSIRHCIYGMPMEVTLRKRIMETFDATLQLVCGQTEAGQTLYFDSEWQLKKEGNYVGRSGPLNDVAIMDEDGNLLPPGEPGEIVYRGQSIMDGYLQQPEKTAETWRQSWHHSEDVGVRDEDGLVLFLDRKKDMIKTGGENVSSSKVENAVSDHSDVKEAAVVGLPHDRWGEAVTAFVITVEGTDPDPGSIREFTKDALAPFEVPKAVEVVSSLPTTATGKVRKREVADAYGDYYS